MTSSPTWKEKAGIENNEFTGNSATEYGKSAEEHVRALFLLDNPQYECEYHEYRMYANDEHQFLYATLDGELIEKETGRKGILEIKTTTIQNSSQWEEWDDKIPQTYYAQVLHQLYATGWDFVVLRAYIRYYKGTELRATVRDYTIDRNEVGQDISALVAAEIKFWDSVISRKEPATILPDI